MIEAPEFQKRLVHLLEQIAKQKRSCSACGRTLYFVEHPRTRKLMPITDEAQNHFIDCPEASKFKRKATTGA